MTLSRPTAALLSATVIVYADLYIPQPLLPLLARSFGVAPATAGLLISVVVLAIALSSSLHGTLSDRLGRRPVMVTACALLALPTLLCALAPSFRALLLFRALQGVLIPGVTAIAVAFLGDEFPGAALGRQVGLWIAASVAGGLLGRVASGPLAAAFGWRAPFVFFGLATLGGAALLARGLPRRPPPPRAAGSPWRGALAHLYDRRLLGAFIVGGSVFFGFIGVFTYLPFRLAAPPFRFGTSAISAIFFVYVSGIFTSLFTESVSRRFGERLTMAAGFVVAALGAAGTAIDSVLGILAALVVLNVGMFLVQATAPAYVNRTAAAAKGAAGSMYVSVYYVGATLGAYLPGHALETHGWWGVVASCAGAFLVGLLADLLLCR